MSKLFIKLTRYNGESLYINADHILSFKSAGLVMEQFKTCKSVVNFSNEDSYDYFVETPEEIIKLLNLTNQN